MGTKVTGENVADRVPIVSRDAVLVAVRLYFPHSGLFTGEIDAVDAANSCYRVEFDNPSLGIQNVQDVDIMVCGDCI